MCHPYYPGWDMGMRWAAAAVALAVLGGTVYAAEAPRAAFYEVRSNDIQVAADGSSLETIKAEIHARNDAEAIDGARVIIPFIALRQSIEVVEAYTRKADGSRIPVDPTTMFEQASINIGILSLYTDLRLKVLLFPQFEAGDTAVYIVRLKTPQPLFKGRFLRATLLSRDGHAHDIRETVTAPQSLGLEAETHDIELSRHTDGANTVFEWHLSQKDDKPDGSLFARLRTDKLPRYIVSNFKGYEDLGRAYADTAQPKIVVNDKVKALADKITAGERNSREKARLIYEWVSKHIRYVAIELGTGSVIPHDTDQILAAGFGDCKDHDTVLQALLRAKGIEAESALIPAGPTAFKLTDVPSMLQLNHVITYLPKYNVYLDSSLGLAPFGVLTPAEYGKPVVLVSQGGARLSTVPVMPPGLSTNTIQVRERLGADGTVTGTYTRTMSGPESIERRVEGIKNEAIGPEEGAKSQLGLRNLKEAKGRLREDSPVGMQPSFTSSITFTSTGWADWLAGKTREHLPGDSSTLMRGLPADFMAIFMMADKNDAMTCYSQHLEEDVQLELPPGIKVPPLPADKTLKTANLQFTQHWTLANGTISVHRVYVTSFATPMCSAELHNQMQPTLKEIDAAYSFRFKLNTAN